MNEYSDYSAPATCGNCGHKCEAVIRYNCEGTTGHYCPKCNMPSLHYDVSPKNNTTPVLNLIAAVSKMMLCFPEKIKEGSIDEDFTLPALIVNDVRKALRAAKGGAS